MIKRLLYFLFLISSSELLFSQTVQSTCTAPASVVTLYKKDAYRLAVRRCFTSHLPYKDSVRIDHVLFNTYLRALLAVYNATALPARDTVCKYFPVHTLISPDLNTLLIEGDTSKSWLHDFKNYVFPTSNSTINNLLSKHSFTQTSYSSFIVNDLVGFESDSSWNINALAYKFGAIPGLIYASSNVLSLDGWDITDSINSNYTTLIYKMAWGDCMAGCMYRKYWKFRIYNDCSVSCAGSIGPSIIDFFAGIKESGNNFNNGVTVFPNPCGNKLQIQYDALATDGLTLDVISTNGELIFNSNYVNELDVSFLHKGMYFLRIRNNNNQKYFKFIKE